MIFVGVIILTGVLLFAAIAAYSVHRRSVLIDRKKTALQNRRSEIFRQDQQLTESVTGSLLLGKPLADVVPTMLKDRAALLREIGGEAGNWTAADVDVLLNRQLHASVGRINGWLAVRLSLFGIGVLVLTIVMAASLYAFLESVPGSNVSTSPHSIGSPAESYDPFSFDVLDPTEAGQP